MTNVNGSLANAGLLSVLSFRRKVLGMLSASHCVRERQLVRSSLLWSQQMGIWWDSLVEWVYPHHWRFGLKQLRLCAPIKYQHLFWLRGEPERTTLLLSGELQPACFLVIWVLRMVQHLAGHMFNHYGTERYSEVSWGGGVGAELVSDSWFLLLSTFCVSILTLLITIFLHSFPLKYFKFSPTQYFSYSGHLWSSATYSDSHFTQRDIAAWRSECIGPWLFPVLSLKGNG